MRHADGEVRRVPCRGPNRTMLTELLEDSLARTQRAAHRFAVLFIDLDRFKYVNDSLGHVAGDRILIGVSGRLKANLRPGDVPGAPRGR